MKKHSLLCTVLLFFLCSCNPNSNKVDFIITNAAIIDIQNDSLSSGNLIVVSGNKIIAIDDVQNLDSYESPNVIDATGKFIMPGLWDMHVHFRGGDSLITQNKNFLPLFLAHGITTVRDAGGDITPHVLEWRDEIQNGTLDGPNIYSSGPKLDGTRPAWPGSISVEDDDDVKVALDSLESLDADYVKVYDGNLTKEAFYEIIRQAEDRGLKSTGHMPMSADFLEAVKLGLDGTEHLYFVLKAGSPLADSLTEAGLGYGMINPLIDSYDPDLADEVYAELRERKHYITPTLKVSKTLAEILITDHSSDTMLNYIDPAIQETYLGRINSAKRGGEGYTQNRAKMITHFRSMILPMHQAGVPILAGSDSGPFNSHVYPGISLHEELGHLVEAGLTPREALMTSIVNGPEFFEASDSYGSIEEGKTADLLILNQNPLENIEHTQSINTVIVNGKIYSRKDLTEMLNALKEE